jgi:transcriptional regulator with XRE-family HTH domain
MIDRIESGRRLAAARQARGLTQAAAAELAPISARELSDLERGRRMPSWALVLELVGRLGLDPAIVAPELVGRKASK